MAGSTNDGYLAARFYGMRSHLLEADDYEKLYSASDIDSFITILRSNHEYKNAVEEHLLLEEPLTAVNSAINDILSIRMKKILSFSGGSYEQGFHTLSLRWEISNIHLAIRAIIEKTTFPVNFIPLGHLKQEELKYLTSVSDLNEALGYLESILNPFAPALRSIVEKHVSYDDLNTIDGIFNKFSQDYISKEMKLIKDEKIFEILNKTVLEERELANTKLILNLIGKISRGALPRYDDFGSAIFPGKARIRATEIEEAVKNKDISVLKSILERTSYRNIFDRTSLDTGSSRILQEYIEDVDQSFYKNQVRKRFKKHAFNLGLAFFWQMVIEARNLRILVHGIENFTRDEIKRRLIYV